jgi:hypothetical protein
MAGRGQQRSAGVGDVRPKEVGGWPRGWPGVGPRALAAWSCPVRRVPAMAEDGRGRGGGLGEHRAGALDTGAMTAWVESDSGGVG